MLFHLSNGDESEDSFIVDKYDLIVIQYLDLIWYTDTFHLHLLTSKLGSFISFI